MSKRVAVIGGGVAGVSCAHALQAAGVDVRLFERGPALGGRCATRLWQGHLLDLGVQYFTAQSVEFKKELLTRLRQFRPIISPILGAEGQLVLSTTGPRFYVLQGNHYLAHVLAQGVKVTLNCDVARIVPAASGFTCAGENFDAVVTALPGPEAAKILGLDISPALYEPIIVAMLEYGTDEKDPTRQCYARALPPDSPVIAASFCENHKAGRIIGNKSVFVVHASSSFSVANAGRPPEDYLPRLIDEHERLWQLPSALRRAASVHIWHYGRPRDETRVESACPPGAFFCGDSRSESSVEEVWLDGRKTAQRVIEFPG